jgi:S1-C subfamily serine protease
MSFYIRLALLAVIAMPLGMLSGCVSTIELRQRNEELAKRTLVAERPAVLLLFSEQKVFKVLIESPFGTGGGTAHLVATRKGNVVLTNRHICDAVEANGGVATLDQANGKRYYTKVARKAGSTDLCLLETPEDLINAPAYKVASEPLISFEIVYVYGHPFLEPLTENHGSFVHQFRFPDLGNEGDAQYFNKVRASRLGFRTRPGNSGSPVLNFKGELVGVVFGHDSVSSLFIPLSSIREFLSDDKREKVDKDARGKN